MLQRLRKALRRSLGASSPEAKCPTVALVIFLVVACYWCVLCFPLGAEYLSGDQYIYLLAVLKGEDPSLFPRDLAFNSPDSIRGGPPFFMYFLQAVYRWSGDLTTGFKLMIFPLTFLYLTGAYLLFRRFGGTVSVAIALALLSSVPYRVPFATDLFGLGPIGFMLARTFYTAATPWIFLAFVAWFERPVWLMSLFFAAGLMANFHPVSGLCFGPVLVLAYLVEQRCAPRAWAISGGFGLAMLAGALPIIIGQLQMLNRQPASAMKFKADIAEALSSDLAYFAYPPHTMAASPRWLVDFVTLAIALASIVLVIWWFRREEAWLRLPLRVVTIGALAYMLYPTGMPLLLLLAILSFAPRREQLDRRERLAVFFALSLFWVNVGGLVAVQAIVDVFERPILFVIMNRGMRYAIFAAYLLLSVLLYTVDWSRVAGRLRLGIVANPGRVFQAACVGLLIVAFFWQVRGAVRNTIKAREVGELTDLRAAAQWARESTESTAVFLFDSAAFRVLARRSLAFSWKDIGVVTSHRPDQAAAWAERRATLRKAGSDPAALWNAGVRFGADYVVIPARSPLEAELASRVRYRNNTYVVLVTKGEGTNGGKAGKPLGMP
jgi:hypothetical protein